MFWYHGPNFFWIFILVIVLGGIVSRIIRSHQREKTIRLAIEKGVSLDPGTLNSLQRSASNPDDTRAGLLTGAITTFSVGAGLMVMGFVLSLDGQGDALHPLMAVGGLLWCIALGLFVSRLAYGRRS
ncbi:MAG: hypothetical protein JSR60_05325 [Proteobacteria bacterium]|nr:hypothetical protein [Pseudomonadota bacterium]